MQTGPQEMMTDILIVDDSPLTSMGIRAIIEAAAGVSVCGIVGRGSSAVIKAATAQPHVAVLCVTQGDEECAGDVAALSSMVPVLLITTDEDSVPAAFRHGATGCLMYDDTTPDRLVSAVATVASGQVYLSSGLLQSVISERDAVARGAMGVISRCATGRVDRGLTQRECEVMDLVAVGLGNGDIAARLFLSEKTVRNYLSHAYAVLGATSRTQAALSWRGASEPSSKTPA